MWLDVLTKVKEILATERDDAELDKFLSEVRESLTASNRQFLQYSALIVGSLVTYHLLVYGGSKAISLNGVQLTDTTLFRRVFLIFPAALLAAMASVGYLRRLQRAVFDCLVISRYPILARAGLHELRLPGDFTLGLFVLGEVGGVPGRMVRGVVGFLCVVAFIFAPTAYVLTESIKNIQVFGLNDVLCLTASVGAILVSVSSFLIVHLAGRIRP